MATQSWDYHYKSSSRQYNCASCGTSIGKGQANVVRKALIGRQWQTPRRLCVTCASLPPDAIDADAITPTLSAKEADPAPPPPPVPPVSETPPAVAPAKPTKSIWDWLGEEVKL